MTGEPDSEERSITALVSATPESMLQQRVADAMSSRGYDPYSTNIGAVAVAKTPRRTLDDMRRLSEQIKRMRACSI